MSRTSDGNGFLARWATRKRASATAVEPAERTPPPPRDPAGPSDAQAQAAPPRLTDEEAAALTDAEALERLALPDPATLSHGADFTAFLRDGVPKRLRRLALRRLWAVTPGGAALDGLVDYADDYTDSAVAVGAIVDSYEVGKGLRAHSEALAREAREKAAGEIGDAAPEAEGAENETAEGEPAAQKPATEKPAAEQPAAQKPAIEKPATEKPVTAQADPAAAPPHGDAAAANHGTDGAASPAGRSAPKEPVLQKPRKMAFRFEPDRS